MNPRDYWKEAVANSADANGIMLTIEQVEAMARDMETSHENYGMAFYSPSSSDRVDAIKREHEAKIKQIQNDLENRNHHANEAMKRALHLPPDTNLTIGNDGGVYIHGGRTEQIV